MLPLASITTRISQFCLQKLGVEPARRHVLAFFIAWVLERCFFASSNWIPLLLAVWAIIKYERQQRKLLVEELNEKRKWRIQNTHPLTPLEPCEWLNKLIMSIWPNYMEPKLSHDFAATMMKTLRKRKPKFIDNIELEEFSLGLASPTVGLECAYWTKERDEEILHLGFDWSTDEMSILLAMTMAGPLKKRVDVVINSLQVKGDLRIVPVLDGKCALYSFDSSPELHIGVALGGDSESSQMIEIPGIASLLERIMLHFLVKRMVEPNRSCFSLPVINLKKSVSDAKIRVTVVSGNNLYTTSGQSSGHKIQSAFVEVKLENFTKKTKFSKEGDTSPYWGETFDMMIDGSSGSIYVTVYGKELGKSNLYSLGSSKIRVRYIKDDSTVFWCNGKNKSSIAVSADHPGKDVEMTVPLMGSDGAEITVKLLVNQWNYTDNTEGPPMHGLLGSVSSFQESTGRVIKITVEEGRNLAPKDKSGKSDPYVLLQYGKTKRKTKTISQCLDPVWNQTFEFAEISGGELLKLKCYDADMLIDDSLGSARVNLEGFEDDESRNIWIPLENVDVGEIRLTIKMLRPQTTASEPAAETARRGVLELVLIEAKDLVAADLCGTSDPFVVVHHGKQRQRTKVIHKTLNPQWNQTLQFVDDGKPLELHVKDHNMLLPTASIGYCEVEYADLSENQTKDSWIRLKGVKKGEIHVKVTRRFHTEDTSIPSEDSVNANQELSWMPSRISDLAREAQQLAEEDDMQQMYEKIAGIESMDVELDMRISQVLKEKETLLSKINDLERLLVPAS